MVPVTKTNRFDEVSKKPIPNLFNPEVMRALNTRGGAMWEREVPQEERQAAGGGGEMSWSERVRSSQASAEINYNEKFGLQKCNIAITKTLLAKITEQIEKVDKMDEGEDLKDGERLITEKEFLASVMGAGLSHLTKDQYATMFRAIDKDGSGKIDISEWMAAVTGVDS